MVIGLRFVELKSREETAEFAMERISFHYTLIHSSSVKHPCLISILNPSPYLTLSALPPQSFFPPLLALLQLRMKCTVVTAKHESTQPLYF